MQADRCSWSNQGVVKQSNSGLDLHVDLDPHRVRESLERALRDAVRSGRLPSGTLLPPSRALAADLGVARATVVDAYGQLVAEGWLDARQGSGTRVAAVGAPEPGRHRDRVASPANTPYDFRAGRPDVSSFPRTEWVSAVRQVLLEMPASALDYGDPRGRPELRAALAAYLGRARGVRADPEAVVVCSGYAEALWLVGRALHDVGVRDVAVEAFGHAQHRAVLADTGQRLHPLDVDDEGAVVDGWGDVGAAVLTPAHQFPLGWALSPRRRAEVLRWADDADGFVVEDDYDAEFRYDRRAVGALQPVAPGHVIHAGTTSKTLAPAVRLSWLVLPEPLVDPVVERRRLLGQQVPAIDQLALAHLITTTRYDRHVRRSRLTYARRRAQLVGELARHAPESRAIGLPAGLHSVVELAPGDSEGDAIARARSRGVAVEGLATYSWVPGSAPPSLVVGWAAPPPHMWTSGLRRLCRALAG